MGKSGNPAKRVGTISWYSNSPDAPTGYGVQSEQVLKRLVRDGHSVAVLSNYGQDGTIGSWDSGYGAVRVYPRGAEPYSQDVTPLNHMHWVNQNRNASNVLVTLYDAWVLKGKRYDDLNIASWIPIDHLPVPPAVAAWCAKPNVTPLAMSKFGKAQLADRGIDSLYIPHAFDEAFIPTFKLDGVTGREYLGIGEDKFVVGMNAANKASGSMHRKAFSENFLAFSLFAKRHPDAVLYVHSDVFGAYGGWNLTTLCEAVGLSKEQVVFVDPIEYLHGSITQKTLALLYTTMDVLLATSYGEGFGVATIEAQACGTPVIGSNFAATAELVSDDGWLVEGQPLYDAGQSAFFNIPSVPGIVDALEQAYQRGRGRSQASVDFAQDFGAEKVYQTYWKPALSKLLK
jgi:glycosyltransferase involved in cell wall biosynthesis